MSKNKPILKVFPNGNIMEILSDGPMIKDKNGRCTIKVQQETICLPEDWRTGTATIKEDSK